MKKFLFFLASGVLALLLITCQRGEETYNIGVIVPLTGPFSVYGEPVNNGMLLALEEINNKGGINGKPIKLIIEDDQSESRTAVSAANKLINVNSVPVIIGPLSSGNSMAVAPVSQRNGIVQLSTLAGIPDLSLAGDYIFRIYPSSNIGAQYAIDKAVSLFNPQRIAILYPSNPFGEVSLNIYSATARENNISVVATESYLDGDKDFRTQLTKIRTQRPDLIMSSAYWSDGAAILRQMVEMNLHVPIIGEDGWHGPLAELVGSRGLELLYFADLIFGEEFVKNQRMQSFISSFKNKYNTPPNTAAAIGYDALYVIYEAIKESGYDAENIKAYLLNTNFDGALGSIVFDENGDNIGFEFGLFKLDSSNNPVLYSK